MGLVSAAPIEHCRKASSSNRCPNDIGIPYIQVREAIRIAEQRSPPHTETWSPRSAEYAGSEWIGIGAEADCDKLQARHEARMGFIIRVQS